MSITLTQMTKPVVQTELNIARSDVEQIVANFATLNRAQQSATSAIAIYDKGGSHAAYRFVVIEAGVNRETCMVKLSGRYFPFVGNPDGLQCPSGEGHDGHLVAGFAPELNPWLLATLFGD